MFDRLVETVRSLVRTEVERVMRLQQMPRLANVVEYDPKRHAVKVQIQPEGVKTSWIPLTSPWIGNGWGMVAPPAFDPNNGDQVKVVFPEYGSNQGMVVSRAYDQRNPPPTALQNLKTGEIGFVDKAGSTATMTADGKVTINGKVEIDLSGPTIKITATSEIDITSNGPVNVKGSTINLN